MQDLYSDGKIRPTCLWDLRPWHNRLPTCYTIGMKKWTLLCLLFLPLMCAAQPKKSFLQLLRNHTLPSKMQQNLQRSLARTHIAHVRTPHAIQKLIFTPTPTISARPAFKDNLVLSPTQKKDWLNRYEQTLANFEQLKKEANPFLYYQSVALETREISVEEKRRWLDKMFPLYDQLLSLYLNTNQDAPLKYALAYLRYGVAMVDPFLVSTLPTLTKPYATPFELESFFLYPQHHLPEPWVDLDGKHIVIVNDDASLLEHFEHLADIGVLFPSATLHTHGDATQFLLWMQHPTHMPDIIFTDIQLGESNGYYIASRLRERGYQGAIIALTSYTETETYARRLAQAGFDGLVSLDDQYYRQTPFVLRITQAAQVYLRRKNK